MDYLQYSKYLKIGVAVAVLNLIINGLPSILENQCNRYAKGLVLNLIINGLPSIQRRKWNEKNIWKQVLNLIINGLPSILEMERLTLKPRSF